MTAPMTWARVWRIIRRVKGHSIALTPGVLAYLEREVWRMDRDQAARFRQECSGVLSQGCTA